MADTKELIAEARNYPACGCVGIWNELQRLADALEASEARAEAAELRVTAFINWQAEMQIERNGMLAEREAATAKIERLRAVARGSKRLATEFPRGKEELKWMPDETLTLFLTYDTALDAIQPGDLDD